MLKQSLFALALAAALPMSAQASEISYSFIEVDYLNQLAEASNGDDVDTWSLQGSAELGDTNFYLFGSFQPEGDIPHYTHTDDDFSTTKFGGGYHWSLGDSTSMHVEVGAGNETWDESDFYTVGLGVRHSFGDHFELSGNATHRFGSQYLGDTTFIEIAGQYKFNENWGAVASYTWGDWDGEGSSFQQTFDASYKVGIRYSF